MKRLAILVIAVIGLGEATEAQDTSSTPLAPDPRLTVLNLRPQDIGLNRENFPYQVFAVLMETGFEEEFFTLSSVADGSTDLYFSTGNAITGGREHESVRRATSYLLYGAQHFHKKAQAVTSYPSPRAGEVIFYFITFEGVLSYSATEETLRKEKDDFSDFFLVAHEVISELRKIDALQPKESN